MIALMTAVTCILGPLSVPIGPVPISLTNLAIYFTVILLGWKKGTVSYVIYLLIGLVGVPVFSRFVREIGTGPIGTDNGPKIQVTAVIKAIIAIVDVDIFFSFIVNFSINFYLSSRSVYP